MMGVVVQAHSRRRAKSRVAFAEVRALSKVRKSREIVCDCERALIDFQSGLPLEENAPCLVVYLKLDRNRQKSWRQWEEKLPVATPGVHVVQLASTTARLACMWFGTESESALYQAYRTFCDMDHDLEETTGVEQLVASFGKTIKSALSNLALSEGKELVVEKSLMSEDVPSARPLPIVALTDDVVEKRTAA